MRGLLGLFGLAILELRACGGTDRGTGAEGFSDTAQVIAGLRGAYAAFIRGDIDAAVKPLDEQVAWAEPAEFPGGGAFDGREGAKRYLKPERFIAAGNRIVVFVHPRIPQKTARSGQM